MWKPESATAWASSETSRFETGSALGPEDWAKIKCCLPEVKARDFGSTVAVDFTLEPKEEKVIRYILAWYAPQWHGDEQRNTRKPIPDASRTPRRLPPPGTRARFAAAAGLSLAGGDLHGQRVTGLAARHPDQRPGDHPGRQLLGDARRPDRLGAGRRALRFERVASGQPADRVYSLQLVRQHPHCVFFPELALSTLKASAMHA